MRKRFSTFCTVAMMIAYFPFSQAQGAEQEEAIPHGLECLAQYSKHSFHRQWFEDYKDVKTSAVGQFEIVKFKSESSPKISWVARHPLAANSLVVQYPSHGLSYAYSDVLPGGKRDLGFWVTLPKTAGSDLASYEMYQPLFSINASYSPDTQRLFMSYVADDKTVDSTTLETGLALAVFHIQTCYKGLTIRSMDLDVPAETAQRIQEKAEAISYRDSHEAAE